MTFLELAEQRYSVRKFSDKPVEQEKTDRLLEAVRLAPTACNNQPQRVLVIRGKEALDRLKGCTPYHFNAPLAFLVCYEESSAWVREGDNHSSGEVDASIAGTHLMLAAADLGLGSTWVMAFDPAAMRSAYKIPDSVVPVALFPVGYPAQDSRPAHLHAKSMGIDDMTVIDSF